MDHKKKKITEEDGLHKEWYQKARKLRSSGEVLDFTHKLIQDYEHDYGTVCHATAASAVSVMYALFSKFGMTNFQASVVVWEIIREILHLDGHAKLVKYEDMLFPQYEHHFEKTISQHTFNWLQKRARELLKDDEKLNAHVKEHLESIDKGNVPFGYTIKQKNRHQ